MKLGLPVRWLLTGLLAILLRAGLLVLAGGKAGATSCAVPLSPEEQYAQYEAYADAVVVGTVEQDGNFPEPSQVGVSVERVFKGNAGETIGVEEGSGNLTLDFREDGRYVFYLQEQDNGFTVPFCGGEEPLSGELPPEATASLGEGAVPEATPQSLPDTSGFSVPAVALTLAPGALVTAGSSALWRRTG